MTSLKVFIVEILVDVGQIPADCRIDNQPNLRAKHPDSFL